MPIFEYQCQKCTKKFETLVMSKNEVVQCPECGSGELKKLLSLFGFKPAGSRFVSSSTSSGGCTSCSTKACSSCH
ncbi:FmdB family transcriptional regulator [Candidatus Desantisbacteria bacterium CG2_30_40_21]|uniref:FmdB family transcriptional regulator n=5 Tax=unclassified Candidatus Desantisiibacteriota TaxID=3106372 RepID=A0A2M7JE74_9BACT|nr:MAG: FmdB family transcriptional regulator [Candidatus Desantisbacteria bacterium CG2_30_40_21]PIP41852.1 MAG: FmdB family transcriptional regulator [Candidatus Desantisbacteria bacterium CG23_combo_of_CG06-09_8_20_14_all_40_23]PIX17698.1 MAG: FmdB family transcriptional regulator [Candidatus Desantisbacteria bacterium CG_4_8_14_3_um_filter_40_12]PIY18780.1 MAG: FmdB family transcriptional regulator [Candidatus Desantisbacteria bacterium CG_4_10_14_3_um_filter_40_18]PJB30348.1 MAG: FmdB fami